MSSSLSARAMTNLLGQWRPDGSIGYRALADQLRLLFIDGRIPVGTRIPAERELAAALDLSRTTVSAAYRDLRDSGYLESVRGSGSEARLPASAPVPNTFDTGGFLDFSKAAVGAHPAIAQAARAAAEELPAHLATRGYDLEGLPRLRAAVAERYTSRGLPTESDQVMVTLGGQHAISLLSRLLISPGTRVLLESPTYPHASEALRSAGGRISVVSVDNETGWDADGLIQTIRRDRPTVAYLMPDFHNPTGQSMPTSLRSTVIREAHRSGTILIADETIGELNIDRDFSPMPFAAYADRGTEETVVTIGSAGKTLWGGLRIGWIRASRPLIRRLIASRAASDLGTPLLEQLLVARLVPDFDEILSLRRAQLRTSRDHLEREIAHRFPDWTMPKLHGGLVAWVGLGAPVSSALTLAAHGLGLLITAGPRFGHDGAFERFIRIPIAYAPDDLDKGLDVLEQAWRQVTRQQGRLQPADTDSPELLTFV